MADEYTKLGYPQWKEAVGTLCGVRPHRLVCDSDVLRELSRIADVALQLRAVHWAHRISGAELSPSRVDALRLGALYAAQYDDAALARMFAAVDAIPPKERRRVLRAVHDHVLAPYRELFLRCAEGVLETGDPKGVPTVERAAAMAHQTAKYQGRATSKERAAVVQSDARHAQALQEQEWSQEISCGVQHDREDASEQTYPFQPSHDTVEDKAKIKALKVSYKHVHEYVTAPFSTQSMMVLMHACAKRLIKGAILEANSFKKFTRVDEATGEPAPVADYRFLQMSWSERLPDEDELSRGPLHRNSSSMQYALGMPHLRISVALFLSQIWIGLHQDGNMDEPSAMEAKRLGREVRRWSFWKGVSRHVEYENASFERHCDNRLGQQVVPCLVNHIAGVNLEPVEAPELLRFFGKKWADELAEADPTEADIQLFVERSAHSARSSFEEGEMLGQYPAFLKMLREYLMFEWPEFELAIVQALSLVEAQRYLRKEIRMRSQAPA